MRAAKFSSVFGKGTWLGREQLKQSCQHTTCSKVGEQLQAQLVSELVLLPGNVKVIMSPHMDSRTVHGREHSLAATSACHSHVVQYL